MGELFGTDGIRGEANLDLTSELAFKVGKAGGYYLTRGKENPKVLIGKDTRISGDMLEASLIAGITSLGIDVIKLGVVPTPIVAYLTKQQNVAAGIMISASHNPAKDNGIKFFNQAGLKLTDQQEDDIEEIIFNDLEKLNLPTGDKVGKVKCAYDSVEEYINYIKTTIEDDFSGLKIVIDTANGAAYKIAPQVLSQLGAEVIVLNNQPTGLNINENCGSTCPEVIQQAVIEHDADLGIAHDGDADRVIAVDEQGQLIDGDYILAICGRHLIAKNKLVHNKVVATKYSNLGLHQTLEEVKGEVVVTKNGDRYVLAKMQEEDYILGGEKSGHIIFLEYNTTGDGLLTALQLINVVQQSNQSLSELRAQMTEFPQLLVNVEVTNKNWEENQAIQDIIKEVETILGEKGRIFVRASGTEPVIRIMVEGPEKEELERLADNVAKVVEQELN